MRKQGQDTRPFENLEQEGPGEKKTASEKEEQVMVPKQQQFQ